MFLGMTSDQWWGVLALTVCNIWWMWYLAVKQPRDIRRAAMKRRMKELRCNTPCYTQPCKCHGGGKWGRLF